MNKATYSSLLVVIVCAIALDGIAQKVKPLNAPLIISGSFGEPRENHFHTGVDFTTKGKTGIAVFAFDDGYVSRIKVSSIGYGKALYITHANGLMSVYGHLSKFNDELQNYVTKEQYRQQKFEVELYPEKNQFKVSKGQIIAYSGNSGGSGGPHLHFEVRDASGESYPLNPLKYDLALRDTIAPQLRELAFYNTSKSSDIVNPKQFALTKVKSIFKIQNRNQPDTIRLHFNEVGVGIKTYDLANGCDSDGFFGIYSLQMKVDGNTVYSFAMNRLDFSEGRYANCHIDYKQKKKNKEQFYRCFQLPGNKASIYSDEINNGIIVLLEGETKKIEITVSDYFNNTSKTEFYLNCPTSSLLQSAPPVGIPLTFNEEKNWSNNHLKLKFDSGTFYDNIYLRLDSTSLPSAYSRLYKIHDEFTPLHKSFTLSIRLNDTYKNIPINKLVIMRLKSNGGTASYKTSYSNGWLTAQPKELGNFYVELDTVTPALTPINFKTGQTVSQKTLTLKMTDKLSGIDTYNFYIDNQWILAEYDAKNDLISIDISKVAKGEHILKAIVSDVVQNKKTYTFKIINQ
jgi:hypothetical protein